MANHDQVNNRSSELRLLYKQKQKIKLKHRQREREREKK